MKKLIVLLTFILLLSGCKYRNEYGGAIFINPLTGEGCYVNDPKAVWEMRREVREHYKAKDFNRRIYGLRATRKFRELEEWNEKCEEAIEGELERKGRSEEAKQKLAEANGVGVYK